MGQSEKASENKGVLNIRMKKNELVSHKTGKPMRWGIRKSRKVIFLFEGIKIILSVEITIMNANQLDNFSYMRQWSD